MSSNTITLANGVVIAANNGSYILDVNLAEEGISKFAALIEVTYAATGSTNGLACEIYTGNGNPDPAAVIGQAPDYFPIMVIKDPGSAVAKIANNKQDVTMSPVVNSGAPQTVKTSFYLNDILKNYPNWVRFKFINTNTTNIATLVFRADISNNTR